MWVLSEKDPYAVLANRNAYEICQAVPAARVTASKIWICEDAWVCQALA